MHSYASHNQPPNNASVLNYCIKWNAAELVICAFEERAAARRVMDPASIHDCFEKTQTTIAVRLLPTATETRLDAICMCPPRTDDMMHK